MREPMAVLSEELRDQIRALFPNYPNKRAVVLPALHLVQDAHRYVAIVLFRWNRGSRPGMVRRLLVG